MESNEVGEILQDGRMGRITGQESVAPAIGGIIDAAKDSRERMKFIANTVLFLELKLQEIEYGVAFPEDIIGQLSKWIKELPTGPTVREQITLAAEDFLKRQISSESRSFAFALYELGKRRA